MESRSDPKLPAAVVVTNSGQSGGQNEHKRMTAVAGSEFETDELSQSIFDSLFDFILLAVLRSKRFAELDGDFNIEHGMDENREVVV